jgi:NitT/TauT family transport system permease protein
MLVAFFSAWQFLPQISALSEMSHIFDPFFISSPLRIFIKLEEVTTGRNGDFLIWTYLWPTLASALTGTVIGVTLGAIAGLILSSSRVLTQLFHPFVVAVNATPRIALIPIVVIIAGPTFAASVVICIMVVFFVAFFNAFEGGRTVAPHLLNNAKLLGGSKFDLMLHIRLPYVSAWTLAALPLAMTFAIISVVTGEILTGYPGMGRLITIAAASADASLTFTVVLVLSVVGIVVVGLAELVKRRVLHWWAE